MNSLKLILGSAAVLLFAACPAQVPPDPVVPKSAVVRSFTATPAEVTAGGEVTLSWDVLDAQAIAVSTVKGTASTIPPTTSPTGTVKVTVVEPTVFVLTASGEGGFDTAAVTVDVTGQVQPVLLTAMPERVTAGQSVTLVWSAPSAGQVTVTDGAGAQVYAGAESTGSITLTPGASTTYTLNAGGQTTSASVTVSPAVFALTATPSAVHLGAEVVLSWKAGGAESVTLSVDGRGELVTVTDPAQIADGSFTDLTPATVPVFGVVTYHLTARLGDEVAEKMLEVFVGSDPIFKLANVPEFAKTGGAFTVAWQTELADRVDLFIDGQQVFTAASTSSVKADTVTFPSPSSPIQFELRATNVRGGVTSKKVTISPVASPTFVSFGATPSAIASGGERVTVSWQVTNARHVRITDDRGKVIKDLTGAVVESGSIEAYPNRNTVYTLQADNTVGDAIAPQTIAVQVTTPAGLTFNPGPTPALTPVQLTGSTVSSGGAMRAVNFVLKDTSGTAFEDILYTGRELPFSATANSESQLAVFPTPFTTTLFGVPITANSVSVSINGWMVFSDTAIVAPNVPPTTLHSDAFVPLAICAWADDLKAAPATRVVWKIDGAGAQRRLIVQWNNVQAGTGTNLTFQAQVYASGEVVMAYKEFTGMGTYDLGAIGIVNATETGAVQVRPDELTNGLHPVANDSFRFFAPLQPPVTVLARRRFDYVVEQQVGSGAIELATPAPIIDPLHFAIEEINYNPATGREQWFEVQNHTATPVELAGWELDFGNSVKHVITPTSGSLLLPANGRLLFGQSANSAEASSGGPAIDYVYGNAIAMPTTAGYVALRLHNTEYTRSAWSTAGTKGTATIFQPDPDLIFSNASARLTCPSSGTYGGAGQIGSPGGSNSLCFKWRMEPSNRAFQPIALTGQVVGVLNSTILNSLNSVTTPLVFTASGGRTVKIGSRSYGDATNPLTVSSAGWIALVPTTQVVSGNQTTPFSSQPNGTLALYWDTLAGNEGTPTDPSGVFWQQFDPDGVSASGDEYTLISYENWRRNTSLYGSSPANSSLNFQLRIDEATGDVEYVYGNMTSENAFYSNGNDATVWFEADSGAYAIKYLVNEPLLMSNTALKFKAL